ncbi:Pre-mRNA splicing factor-domain-containing protein [Boeremia exigua]|uniref:Pre-mRNA splicing factor-domain-containing protein n=1 Tax=Boeremia exigua TaxID=749465 RepID=UPI001E8DC4BB|nr:Pre-mRNA splicing factor-domain-containing protein [Boeremia exigua]KAH6614888.1 Pre-mRNA splicing factor-domain-containing protein [Boeremia exigua]
MGGDLNLKKSWHPHLRKNQERVWKEEKSALEERKQIEKLRKEREEERALEELQRLQESAGGRTVQRRVDWMYAGPGGDGTGVTEEREGYLLGKRRIDQLLTSSDTKDLQKGAAVGIDVFGGANANSARDTQKKVLEDPLLMIQKQKMELQLKAMKDAQKQAKYEEKRIKEKERDRKHRDRDDRHRDYRGDRHRDREVRHRDREDRHRGREDRHKDREDRHKDQDGERSGHHHHSRRDRSRSRDRDYHHRSHHDRKDHRNRNEHQRRSRSPYRGSNRDDRGSNDDDKAERLARMQADAATTEEQRAERVREQAKKDAEEEARVQNNLNSSRRLNAGMGSSDMGLGDAIARGRSRAEVDT